MPPYSPNCPSTQQHLAFTWVYTFCYWSVWQRQTFSSYSCTWLNPKTFTFLTRVVSCNTQSLSLCSASFKTSRPYILQHPPFTWSAAAAWSCRCPLMAALISSTFHRYIDILRLVSNVIRLCNARVYRARSCVTSWFRSTKLGQVIGDLVDQFISEHHRWIS